MQNMQIVRKDDLPLEAVSSASFPTGLVLQWLVGVVVLFGIGSWLVWWSASVQRTFAMNEIRGACQRVMPETVERCVDTVIIQRGGMR